MIAAAAPARVRPAAWSPFSRREARLRPEFALRYPGFRPGTWEPAAVIADRVLAQALLGGGGGILGRVLLDAHFEFRHGTAQGGERHGLRIRRGAEPLT